MQVYFLTSCNTKSYNSKHQAEKIGFLGFYLDMDYLKVKSTLDSLLNINELHYFETTDMLGNKQKNLYHDFSGISPLFCAKVNLRGTYIIDERLINIQLTLGNRSNTGEQRFSYKCDRNELKRLFELYIEKYGTPTLLVQGEKYDWLSKRISNVYSEGPKGRWAMDKIYFWERGNYIIYFDFGYPESMTSSDNPIAKSDASELPDSTSAPIIYYDFTEDYLNKLFDKASRMKEVEFK
jgi:hypothetical protein